MTHRSSVRCGIAAATVLAGLVLCGCSSRYSMSSGTPVTAARVPTREIIFDTDEVTWSVLDVSLDGQSVLFDVLGDIYTVAITGGDAKSVTNGRAWDMHPQFSPDGKRIAFISDRAGAFELWSMDVNGTNLERYKGSRIPETDRIGQVSPIWSFDGRLLFSSSWGAEIRQAGPGLPRGSVVPVRSGPDSVLARVVDTVSMSRGGHVRIIGSTYRVTLPDTVVSVSWSARISRDGNLVAYPSEADDKGEFEILRVLNVTSGVTQTVTDSSERPVSPGEQEQTRAIAFTPDGRSIIFGRRGHLRRVDLVTGQITRIPVRVHVVRNVDVPLHHVPRKIANGGEIITRIIRWPTLNAEQTQVIYSALGHLHTTDIATGRARRLTADSALEYGPAISPDGKWVAYTSWSDGQFGHVMIIPAEGGVPKRVTSVAGRYTNPAWSPDGQALVFIADTSVSRFGLRSSTEFKGPAYVMLHQFSATGTGLSHELLAVYPLDVVPGRSFPVPSFSGDGSRVFVASQVNIAGDESRSGNFLLSIAVDSSTPVQHLRLPKADEVVISPDGRRVAVVRRDSLYVTDVPAAATEAEVPWFDTKAARLVSIASPTYVAWQGARTLTWVSGTSLYRQRLDMPNAQHIVEIDVRHPRPFASGTFAMINARIITMRGWEVIERGAVVITDNRIVSVGPTDRVTIPKDARVVDLAGSTIMPGLVDVHAHFHFDTKEVWPEQNVVYVGNLAYGVTTAYDPSAPMLDAFGQAELVDAGYGIGPRIYASGEAIFGLPDWHDGDNKTSYRDIRSFSDARAIVAHHARFSTAPLKEYWLQRREQRQWLIQAARERGIPVVSHPDSYDGLLTRIVDGYLGIEHDLNHNEPVYADVLRFIAASGVHMTPTLMPIDYYSKQQDMDDPKLRRFLPAPTLEELERGRRMDYQGNRPSYAQLSRLIKAGVLISVGAHGNGPFGLSSHWEMWYFTELGMTRHDALRAATIIGAKKMDLDQELGSVEAGKVADLLVLDANPLSDIKNSTKIRYVIKDGFVYDGATMARIWPTRAELRPWPWQTDAERERYKAQKAQTVFD